MIFTENIQKRIDRTKAFAEAVLHLTQREQVVHVTDIAETMGCSVSVAQTWLIRGERRGLVSIDRKMRPWTYTPK